VKRETRYDYAAAVAMRYQRSGREQKGWILDEFCAATGYNRKYAIKLLRGPFPRAALPPGHGRPPVYGPEEVALLRPCWQIADYVCSKRLAPFLPELLGMLSRVDLTERELAHHGALFGGPGSGKTTYLQLLVEASAGKQPVVVVDSKGGPALADTARPRWTGLDRWTDVYPPICSTRDHGRCLTCCSRRRTTARMRACSVTLTTSAPCGRHG
jgi:hypothetical protein